MNNTSTLKQSWPTTAKGVVPQALTARLDALQESIDAVAAMLEEVLDQDEVDIAGSCLLACQRFYIAKACINVLDRDCKTKLKK